MKEEPVINGAIVKVLAGVLVTLAAKYIPGLNLTDDQINWIAMTAFTLAIAVGAKFTRAKVVPVAKLNRVAPGAAAAVAQAGKP